MDYVHPATAALGLEPGAQLLTWPSGITWWQFAYRQVTDVCESECNYCWDHLEADGLSQNNHNFREVSSFLSLAYFVERSSTRGQASP